MKNIIFVLCFFNYGFLFAIESSVQKNVSLTKTNKSKLSGVNSTLQAQKILASDPVDKNRFGYSVSIHGERALVGARNNEAAYIFKLVNNQWQQIAKLQPPNPNNKEFFGFSVSIFNNRALIGAIADDVNGANSGSVYVFESVIINNQEYWVQVDKISYSSGGVGDYFGWDVELNNNMALIGAPNADGMSSGDVAGAAFVYEFDGNSWQFIERLYGFNSGYLDKFGYSVSLFNDKALVGAPGHSNNATAPDGAAFIFKMQGTSWLLIDEISASVASDYQYFGISVSLGDKQALIGAQGDDGNKGAAYVFDEVEIYGQTHWIQTNKITASDGQALQRFGFSVALDGKRALIGAVGDNEHGTNAGTAYVYQYTDNTWQAQHKLSHPDIENNDTFGRSVDLSGNHLIVGTDNYDTNNQKPDAAYIYNLDVIFKNGFQ